MFVRLLEVKDFLANSNWYLTLDDEELVSRVSANYCTDTELFTLELYEKVKAVENNVSLRTSVANSIRVHLKSKLKERLDIIKLHVDEDIVNFNKANEDVKKLGLVINKETFKLDPTQLEHLDMLLTKKENGYNKGYSYVESATYYLNRYNRENRKFSLGIRYILDMFILYLEELSKETPDENLKSFALNSITAYKELRIEVEKDIESALEEEEEKKLDRAIYDDFLNALENSAILNSFEINEKRLVKYKRIYAILLENVETIVEKSVDINYYRFLANMDVDIVSMKHYSISLTRAKDSVSDIVEKIKIVKG